VRDVEINKQPDVVATELQIGHNLGEMKRKQCFHGLKFDDDAVFDEKVDAISRIQRHILIRDRKPDLMRELQSIDTKLVGEASVVGAFEAACAESAMDFEGGRDDLFCQRVIDHCRPISASPASSAVASFILQMAVR